MVTAAPSPYSKKNGLHAAPNRVEAERPSSVSDARYIGQKEDSHRNWSDDNPQVVAHMSLHPHKVWCALRAE